jgi:ubiquinone/menaquinone biosynthesis C-methylase UbiE
VSTQPRYEQVKRRYRDSVVATTYDSSRFLSAKGQKRNRLMLAAMQRAFDKAASIGTPIRSCLDLPCGTGRLFPWLWQRQLHFVGADISLEMMQAAWTKVDAPPSGGAPVTLVQCDGEYLPFKDRSLDVVFSLRFMFHVPREVRIRILQEMARVSRRWLIVDFRHCYNFRWCFRRLCHGLGLAKRIGEVWSWASLRREVAEAGLRLVGIFSPRRGLSFLSDKWVVLLEKADGKSCYTASRTCGASRESPGL